MKSRVLQRLVKRSHYDVHIGSVARKRSTTSIGEPLKSPEVFGSGRTKFCQSLNFPRDGDDGGATFGGLTKIDLITTMVEELMSSEKFRPSYVGKEITCSQPESACATTYLDGVNEEQEDTSNEREALRQASFHLLKASEFVAKTEGDLGFVPDIRAMKLEIKSIVAKQRDGKLALA
ncbi:hypothetical protein RIF29_33398 [Crotalaria pallida]|uniref:Uncharacterized protein n=1 Tax=Crotalaria pallida TaxID=3830 RepID=A0AAN9E7R2_CROPI